MMSAMLGDTTVELPQATPEDYLGWVSYLHRVEEASTSSVPFLRDDAKESASEVIATIARQATAAGSVGASEVAPTVRGNPRELVWAASYLRRCEWYGDGARTPLGTGVIEALQEQAWRSVMRESG